MMENKFRNETTGYLLNLKETTFVLGGNIKEWVKQGEAALTINTGGYQSKKHCDEVQETRDYYEYHGKTLPVQLLRLPLTLISMMGTYNSPHFAVGADPELVVFQHPSKIDMNEVVRTTKQLKGTYGSNVMVANSICLQSARVQAEAIRGICTILLKMFFISGPSNFMKIISELTRKRLARHYQGIPNSKARFDLENDGSRLVNRSLKIVPATGFNDEKSVKELRKLHQENMPLLLLGEDWTREVSVYNHQRKLQVWFTQGEGLNGTTVVHNVGLGEIYQSDRTFNHAVNLGQKFLDCSIMQQKAFFSQFDNWRFMEHLSFPTTSAPSDKQGIPVQYHNLTFPQFYEKTIKRFRKDKTETHPWKGIAWGLSEKLLMNAYEVDMLQHGVSEKSKPFLTRGPGTDSKSDTPKNNSKTTSEESDVLKIGQYQPENESGELLLHESRHACFQPWGGPEDIPENVLGMFKVMQGPYWSSPQQCWDFMVATTRSCYKGLPTLWHQLLKRFPTTNTDGGERPAPSTLLFMSIMLSCRTRNYTNMLVMDEQKMAMASAYYNIEFARKCEVEKSTIWVGVCAWCQAKLLLIKAMGAAFTQGACDADMSTLISYVDLDVTTGNTTGDTQKAYRRCVCGECHKELKEIMLNPENYGSTIHRASAIMNANTNKDGTHLKWNAPGKKWINDEKFNVGINPGVIARRWQDFSQNVLPSTSGGATGSTPGASSSRNVPTRASTGGRTPRVITFIGETDEPMAITDSTEVAPPPPTITDSGPEILSDSEEGNYDFTADEADVIQEPVVQNESNNTIDSGWTGGTITTTSSRAYNISGKDEC